MLKYIIKNYRFKVINKLNRIYIKTEQIFLDDASE